MKKMIKALVVALTVIASTSNAAVIESTYTSLGGNSWQAGFTVTNDGSPATVGEFTIYFSETLFTGLTLASSPATWDSLVIDSDPGIPATGFLDALAIDPLDALRTGQSQGGFLVGFTYLGQGSPGSLAFDIVDADFQVLFSGDTTVANPPPTQNDIPEPSTYLLLALGLCAMVATRRRSIQKRI